MTWDTVQKWTLPLDTPCQNLLSTSMKFTVGHLTCYFIQFFGLRRWGNVLSSLVFNDLRRSLLLPLPPSLASSLISTGCHSSSTGPCAVPLRHPAALEQPSVPALPRQLDPPYASLRRHSEPPGRHHTEIKSLCRSGATKSRCGAGRR